MPQDVTLQAGAPLRALYGHIICVAGQDLQLGPTGVLRAPPAAAQVLLQQPGWSRLAPVQAEPEKKDTPPSDEQPAKRRGRERA